MRELELRRHATRDRSEDRLSPLGRAQAEDVGRGAVDVYSCVFVSPANRAAETAAWILRGTGTPLPSDHAVVPGLAGKDESGGSPEGMVRGVRALLGLVPEGTRGLAISHTPFVERAASGLVGREVEPFRECEGILLSVDDGGHESVEELRIPGARPTRE